jgi:hypothetical protein
MVSHDSCDNCIPSWLVLVLVANLSLLFKPLIEQVGSSYFSIVTIRFSHWHQPKGFIRIWWSDILSPWLISYSKQFLLFMYQRIKSGWNSWSIWRDARRWLSSRQWTLWAWGDALVQGMVIDDIHMQLSSIRMPFSFVWCLT